jgi:hypothetical protein
MLPSLASLGVANVADVGALADRWEARVDAYIKTLPPEALHATGVHVVGPSGTGKSHFVRGQREGQRRWSDADPLLWDCGAMPRPGEPIDDHEAMMRESDRAVAYARSKGLWLLGATWWEFETVDAFVLLPEAEGRQYLAMKSGDEAFAPDYYDRELAPHIAFVRAEAPKHDVPLFESLRDAIDHFETKLTLSDVQAMLAANRVDARDDAARFEQRLVLLSTEDAQAGAAERIDAHAGRDVSMRSVAPVGALGEEDADEEDGADERAFARGRARQTGANPYAPPTPYTPRETHSTAADGGDRDDRPDPSEDGNPNRTMSALLEASRELWDAFSLSALYGRYTITAAQYSAIYTAVYYSCTAKPRHNNADALYDEHQEIIDAMIIATLEQAWIIDSWTFDELVETYIARVLPAASSLARRLLKYLDRFYVLQHALDPIADTVLLASIATVRAWRPSPKARWGRLRTTHVLTSVTNYMTHLVYQPGHRGYDRSKADFDDAMESLRREPPYDDDVPREDEEDDVVEAEARPNDEKRRRINAAACALLDDARIPGWSDAPAWARGPGGGR